MLDYITVWFVFLLTAGGAEPTGYIEPQAVHKADMSCGLDGAVVGVQLDQIVNPSAITFPDPGIAGKHCRASIAARVMQLQPGTYEIATTEMVDSGPFGTPPVPYIGIDPHVSVQFTRTDSAAPVPPHKPGTMRITPPPQ